MEQSNGILLEGIEQSSDLMEQIIFQSIFKLENVRSTLLPYLNEDVFQNKTSKSLYTQIDKFINEFDTFPTYKDLSLILVGQPNTKTYFTKCFDHDISEYNQDHILKNIESYVKKSLYANAVYQMASEISDPNYVVSAESSIPEDLRNIFSFSFDTSVGMNLFSEEGIKRMIEFFHQASNYVETGVVGLDAMLAGGFHSKTMSLFMLPTNMGKSAIMCALAANMVAAGKKVLYITLEMSEEMISQRIMANIFDIEQNSLKHYDQTTFIKKMKKLGGLIEDKIRVKEFPTSTMNSNVIRRLLKELEEKQDYIPDIIFVDYLELMKPNHSRKVSQKHEDLRTVSEELRDIALEYDLPVVSAMQTNRDGYAAKELDLNDMSGSFGVAMTADFVVAGILSEQHEAAKEYTWRSVKNRFGPKYQEFNVGIDFAKMKLTDLGQMPTINGEAVETVPIPRSDLENKMDKLIEETKNIDDSNNFNEDLGINDYITYTPANNLPVMDFD